MAAGLIALGLGAANFGLGLIKGAEQRSAANSANKARDKQAKQAFERQKKEYEISWGKELVNYSWSVAKTEAARYQDRQKKALYNQRMGWMVDGALVNLELNAEALYDKYVVEEGLRAKQEEIGFDKQMNDLLNQQNSALTELSLQSGELAAESMQAGMQTSQQVAGYMRSVQQKALEAAEAVDQVNDESVDLQQELVLDQASDAIKRDIEMIAAIEESSGKLAAMSARQGHSSTAVRAAKNKLQELGRGYALLTLNQQDRNRRLASFNAGMGQKANEMAQLGNEMESAVEQIKYTNARYVGASEALNLRQLGLQNKVNAQTASFMNNTNSAMSKFTELTIPSFDLAQRQGQREFGALKQKTQQTLNEASVPYIDAIIFDPLKPIKGLKPEFYEPTKQYVPSWGGIVAGSVMDGVNGAMSASYRDGNQLKFY